MTEMTRYKGPSNTCTGKVIEMKRYKWLTNTCTRQMTEMTRYTETDRQTDDRGEEVYRDDRGDKVYRAY